MYPRGVVGACVHEPCVCVCVVLYLVGGDADLQVLRVAQLLGVRDGHEPDLVQGVRGVADELPQEDVLVLVEGVDDDVHQTVHLSYIRQRRSSVPTAGGEGGGKETFRVDRQEGNDVGVEEPALHGECSKRIYLKRWGINLGSSCRVASGRTAQEQIKTKSSYICLHTRGVYLAST